ALLSVETESYRTCRVDAARPLASGSEDAAGPLRSIPARPHEHSVGCYRYGLVWVITVGHHHCPIGTKPDVGHRPYEHMRIRNQQPSTYHSSSKNPIKN